MLRPLSGENREGSPTLQRVKGILEKETGSRIKEIDLYIDSVVYKVEKYLEIPSQKRLSDWDELNETFLKLLEGGM